MTEPETEGLEPTEPTNAPDNEVTTDADAPDAPDTEHPE